MTNSVYGTSLVHGTQSDFQTMQECGIIPPEFQYDEPHEWDGYREYRNGVMIEPVSGYVVRLWWTGDSTTIARSLFSHFILYLGLENLSWEIFFFSDKYNGDVINLYSRETMVCIRFYLNEEFGQYILSAVSLTETDVDILQQFTILGYDSMQDFIAKHHLLDGITII